ncbi:MATE family efflux transporter [Mycoplasma mycoides subsp. capri]|uniref:MATE family efflux transporter n=1 Tax=Mycoplasma mycoides TaxID=2102 RepID=UPI00223F0EDA|nr:MATE family efflux transporter [Mycoplasma mycoides]UZK64564.1 MATE family efflux transporter [Mycoplasma mycoides subsp. capri]
MSSMVNEKQQRARKLFGETPISKAIWIVAIPSLLASLMVGLYSFIDQIFILQFVPKYSNVFGNMNSEIMKYLNLSLHNLTTNDLFKSYNEMLDAYNQQAGMLNASKLTVINSNTIVSISTASFAPLTIFSNAIVYLVPVGSSIYYTKCIGKRLEKTGKNLWATMFWVCIMLSIFSSFLSFMAIWSGLIDKIAGVTQIDPNIASRANIDVLRLQDFYNAAHKLSVQWAKQYVYIYASATILNSLTLYLSYFIRSEGYNTYVMFCAIVANLINIGLDALFIIVFKMGVLGGVVATVIGWVFNTFAYIIYIVIKDHKQKTWLSIKSLFMFKFNKKLLGPIFLLGLGGFLRTFGIGFSFLVMNLLIANSQFAMPEYFQFYWAKGQPIVTLFLITIFGISDGARSLFSYNYTLRKFDRCKEVYLWTMIIALLYSIIVYIFVSLTANNIWVWILNVDSDKIQGTATFIRVISLRIIAVSLVVNSLLAFQGANDIDKTIFSSAFENFISFIIVIPVSYGIAYFVYKTNGNKEIANWIIVGAFVFNCLLASLVLMVFSYWFVFKKLEKIDQAKLSWSRKIEHNFFQRAQQDELLQVQTTN